MWSRPGRGRSAAAVIVLALIAGCQFGEPEQPDDSPPRLPEPTPTAPQGQPPEVTGAHDVLVTGLDIPWDLAFLPDGSALVTERATARILRVDLASRAGGHEVEVVQTIEGVDPDRKSTRLNSSHVKISYAVFCLKKKKEATHT